MPEDTKQVEVVKAFAPIATSIIALLGTLAVAFMQTYSASESKVEQIVNKIDNSVIPKLEDTITNLRERVAVLEAYTKLQTMLFTRSEARYLGSAHKASPSVAPEHATVESAVTSAGKAEPVFELPRLNAPQVIVVEPDKKS